MVPVLYLWLFLISALLLLMLFLALHALAPCLVAACLIMYHCIRARYVASSPAASPLLKMLVFGLLISSLLLVLLPLMGILRLCLTFLCWYCLVCLPLIRGGQRWPTHINVLVPSRYLLRLHLLLVCLLHLHGVYCWSSLAHGRHLKLQCISL